MTEEAPRGVPRLKGGDQNVGTPRVLLDAVEKRFGKLCFDLCASKENACAPAFLTEATDSLTADWSGLRGLGWCNPPYKAIEPWVRKAAATKLRPGSKIFFLTPASVGSNWFRDAVYGKARVLLLNGRVRFVSHSAPYPKDLMIFCYGEMPSIEIWTWGTARRAKDSLPSRP